MEVAEAYKIVYEDMMDSQCDLLKGKYDASNGNEHYMYGIATVMEYIAYRVSTKIGDELSDLFVKNMIASEKDFSAKKGSESNVYLWQLPASSKRAFVPVDYEYVKLQHYVLVYDFHHVFGDDIEQDLEDIYREFNDPELIPSDYHARCVSVGDVIMIKKDGELIFYVVDLQGFKRVN